MLSRRAVLPLLLAPLAACAGIAHDDDALPPQMIPPQPGRLSVIVFEYAGNRIPFHSALIIAGPQGRVLYDPGGFWRGAAHDRRRDVTWNLTPAREAAYLKRDYFGDDPGAWLVHRFDTALPDARAGSLIALIATKSPVPSGWCSIATARALHALPGWADAPVNFFPQVLLNYLRARPDLTSRSWLTP
jgi:hypothetical protein